MDVFKSWLIANLEIVLYVLMPLILIISFFIAGPGYWGILLAITGVIFAISVSTIKKGAFIGVIALIVASAIGLIFLATETEKGLNGVTDLMGNLWIWLIIMAIVGIVFGIVVARYAYRNFDDVVSRRFLYRHSSADVFEEAWKYTINRQAAGFMLVMGITLEIIAMILLSRYAPSEEHSAFGFIKQEMKSYKDSVEAEKRAYAIEPEELSEELNTGIDEIEEISVTEEQPSYPKIDEKDVEETNPFERPDIAAEEAVTTIISGSIKAGIDRQPLMMAIAIRDDEPNRMGCVTGNYQYKKNDKRLQSDFEGLFDYVNNNDIRLNLFSVDNLEWFDLVWKKDKSASGFLYVYNDKNEFEKRSNKYKKKYTVELSGLK